MGEPTKSTAGPTVRTRRRSKLDPDPAVRRAILAAASTALRENGIRGLSIAEVLDRAELSTRAFYRHFSSKEELVAAVFLTSARGERRRLQRRMSVAQTEIEAVAAWIDGRLDLAFDETVKSDLRRLSLEAQSQTFGSPTLVQLAYAEMLRPLCQVLQRGLRRGVFSHIDPMTHAEFIQGVVWASTNRQWRAGDCERVETRREAIGFCLRALGVTSQAIAQMCSEV